MYDSNMSVKTSREYDLAELYDLFQREGRFSQPYELINKGFTKHIRFPGLNKTVIQVYPSGSSIVLNLTKASFLKDLALSVATDGWSDVLSDGALPNATLVAEIAAEVKRLTGGWESHETPPVGAPMQSRPAMQGGQQPAAPVQTAAGAPAAPGAEALKETMLWDGFSQSKLLQAFEEQLVTTDKKGMVQKFKYAEIVELKPKKDTLNYKMADGRKSFFLFDNKDECAFWADLIQSKR